MSDLVRPGANEDRIALTLSDRSASANAKGDGDGADAEDGAGDDAESLQKQFEKARRVKSVISGVSDEWEGKLAEVSFPHSAAQGERCSAARRAGIAVGPIIEVRADSSSRTVRGGLVCGAGLHARHDQLARRACRADTQDCRREREQYGRYASASCSAPATCTWLMVLTYHATGLPRQHHTTVSSLSTTTFEFLRHFWSALLPPKPNDTSAFALAPPKERAQRVEKFRGYLDKSRERVDRAMEDAAKESGEVGKRVEAALRPVREAIDAALGTYAQRMGTSGSAQRTKAAPPRAKA